LDINAGAIHLKRTIIVALVSVLFASCSDHIAPVSSPQSGVETAATMHLFSKAPDLAALGEAQMDIQASGALTVLRKTLEDNGSALANCHMIKAFLRADSGQIADFDGFLSAFYRFFGTRLVPNQPHLVQIQVSGFADPRQIVLIEAECDG